MKANDLSRAGPVRVLLVDDNPKVLRQVAQVLPPEFAIVETLQSGESLQERVDAIHPDVVVLDITLPGQNGIVVASQLRQSGCHVAIVFLTMHQDADYVRSALDAGANGYVIKLRLASDLAPALWAAVAGERFISPLPELRID
jgi:DNA-binding NarL/FixJ family response regulator